MEAEGIWIEIRAGFDQFAPLSFAERAKDAPVFHFDGPLSLMPNPEDIKHPLIRGAENQFRLLLATRTSDLGVVYVECDQSYPSDKKRRVPSSGFPKDLHPIVEIDFPGRRPADKSV